MKIIELEVSYVDFNNQSSIYENLFFRQVDPTWINDNTLIQVAGTEDELRNWIKMESGNFEEFEFYLV
ncbi:MAG: hypothetical protein COA52_01290 [Hyphomicrobiales bacterium]|nr:MAG: hypothetical protein COA52_00200 [Hyphomicrobiales bacterium]PCJ96866.1 MAG: hypothetical protein COA52_01290 [Hyphomicrobiales bacterium]